MCFYILAIVFGGRTALGDVSRRPRRPHCTRRSRHELLLGGLGRILRGCSLGRGCLGSLLLGLVAHVDGGVLALHHLVLTHSAVVRWW